MTYLEIMIFSVNHSYDVFFLIKKNRWIVPVIHTYDSFQDIMNKGIPLNRLQILNTIVNFIANGFYKSQRERNQKVYPPPIRPIHWGFGSSSWKRDNIIETNPLIGQNYWEVFICVEFWPPRNFVDEKRRQDRGYTFWFLSHWDL